MNGWHLAEGGHVVLLAGPASSTGLAFSQCINFGKAEHVSIIVTLGAITSLPTAIQVKAAQTAALAGAGTGTAIPFRYYVATNGGTSSDQLSPPQVATAAGIPVSTLGLSAIANTFCVIEIDSAEIDFLGDSDNVDYPFLFLSTTGGNAFISAVAVMSGMRQAYQGNLSATT